MKTDLAVFESGPAMSNIENTEPITGGETIILHKVNPSMGNPLSMGFIFFLSWAMDTAKAHGAPTRQRQSNQAAPFVEPLRAGYGGAAKSHTIPDRWSNY